MKIALLSTIAILLVGCSGALTAPVTELLPTQTPLPPANTLTPSGAVSPTLSPTLSPTTSITAIQPKLAARAALPPENILKYQCREVLPTLPADANPQGMLVLHSPSGLTLQDFSQHTQREIPGLIPFAGTSPDGKWLAYSHHPEGKSAGDQIVIESANGQRRAQIPEGEGWLIFDRILWLDNERLWFPVWPVPPHAAPVVVLNPFTGKQQELASDYPGLERYQYGPAQGPGLHFVYSSVVYHPSLNLVIYPEQANDGWYLVLWDRQARKALVRIHVEGITGHLPLWLPDGNRFVVVTTLQRDTQKEWLMVSRDGQVQPLTHFGDFFDHFEIGNNASLSPDGRSLAFGLSTLEKDNNALWPEHLIILNLETLEVVNTCIPLWEVPPVWSLDSRYLAVGDFSNAGTPVVLLDIKQGWAAQVAQGRRLVTVGWLATP